MAGKVETMSITYRGITVYYIDPDSGRIHESIGHTSTTADRLIRDHARNGRTAWCLHGAGTVPFGS